ncbi:B12-binding domain-containing radical SAM protein [Desulfobacter hydrogenophilus]|uniref:Radical SAM protein n=1 Tax=Desulfobacter hydrogenophilus TaxID=2291 RepID=A0A328F8K1_9BACT|nr:radical SAM protein [Desulfobacter hydrogenophilus]NDY73008.1 radical SAM protein [Desulfobacter hydrogenophilus]QBH15219.1 radical SAM protein [Desulfobacter hydrogenophilus]RAM00951.1 B12-binding domain-containing radical SAM protein [Desulfobacter hydrogenophilus]
MKVLFVNPSCLDPRVTDPDALQVPIGLYYLASGLLDQGWVSGILNLAPAGPANPSAKGSAKHALDLFTQAIMQEQPDIIGFSVTSPTRINAMACAEKARQILPDSLIVFGGPGATFMADFLFGACPALDVIVKGEGEISTTKLVNAAKKVKANFGTIHQAQIIRAELAQDLGRIPGIVFRNGPTLQDTGPSELVKDLDTLPHPSRYFTYQHLAMSRGCPGKCTFCGSPKFWGTSLVRRHSPQWLFEEIKALAQKGVTHFFISDDTFTMDCDAVRALCEKIIQADLGITWNAISRVDYINESILVPMRRAGCIQISFGVESGAGSIKKILGKPIDNATCVAAFEKVRAAGILPRAYFIYGSPGETDATIQDSIDLMIRLGPLSTVFYMLVTFPGTALYNRAVQKGWTHDGVWQKNIEDLPWWEIDPNMDFSRVKGWGDRLRQAFFDHLEDFVNRIALHPDKAVASLHADFLSRLAMTFSHGEYARDSRVTNAEQIAMNLFEKALQFYPCPRAFQGLAMILQKQKKFSKAMAFLNKGLSHFPKDKDLCVCMGVCLMNTGDFHKALKYFTPFADDPALGQYISICKQKTTL